MAPHQRLAFVFVAAMCLALSSAQTAPPALPNGPSCPPAFQVSMSPCVSYFIGNSSSPSADCCAAFRAIFESQGPCLCAALKGAPGQLGSTFGQVQALLLPSACNLPANACSDVSGTTTTTPTPPASSGTTGAAAPAAAPDPVPGTAGPAGTGSKTIPPLLDSAATGAGRSPGSMAAACVVVPLLMAYVSAVHAF